MNVFILEDDTTQRIRLEKMIKEALEKHSILYKKIFSTFQQARELFSKPF